MKDYCVSSRKNVSVLLSCQVLSFALLCFVFLVCFSTICSECKFSGVPNLTNQTCADLMSSKKKTTNKQTNIPQPTWLKEIHFRHICETFGSYNVQQCTSMCFVTNLIMPINCSFDFYAKDVWCNVDCLCHLCDDGMKKENCCCCAGSSRPYKESQKWPERNIFFTFILPTKLPWSFSEFLSWAAVVTILHTFQRLSVSGLRRSIKHETWSATLSSVMSLRLPFWLDHDQSDMTGWTGWRPKLSRGLWSSPPASPTHSCLNGC